MYQEQRSTFIDQLESQLKPHGFWVTERLEFWLFNIRMLFVPGAYTETVSTCSEYIDDILKDETNLSSALAARVQDFAAMAKRVGGSAATPEQAAEAVTCLMHVVFCRNGC
ncbi:MAG: hypothetical protein Q8Q73_17315 [Stagnimonas sp.]|nr:hypothetical protein [Stagnimonas sp.]